MTASLLGSLVGFTAIVSFAEVPSTIKRQVGDSHAPPTGSGQIVVPIATDAAEMGVVPPLEDVLTV
jgi:hypothetical protein